MMRRISMLIGVIGALLLPGAAHALFSEAGAEKAIMALTVAQVSRQYEYKHSEGLLYLPARKPGAPELSKNEKSIEGTIAWLRYEKVDVDSSIFEALQSRKSVKMLPLYTVSYSDYLAAQQTPPRAVKIRDRLVGDKRSGVNVVSMPFFLGNYLYVIRFLTYASSIATPWSSDVLYVDRVEISDEGGMLIEVEEDRLLPQPNAKIIEGGNVLGFFFNLMKQPPQTALDMLKAISAYMTKPEQAANAAGNPPSETSPRFTGTYEADGNNLRVIQSNTGLVMFKLQAAYGMNVGEVRGNLTVKGNTGRFKDDDCDIQMVFSPDAVSVKQEGNCGMGLNVSGEGDYRLTDTAEPTF